jgi:hypothetical protein
MNDTWALFESGHLTKVRVTLYKAPEERSRLLDAYVTTECEGAVTRSARRAAEAVLSWLPEQHIPKEPMVAGFDLSGLPADLTVTGESCGLAFAIALAAELSGAHAGTIAATGILDSSSAKAEILPVKSICEKVKSAVHALPTDSQILFPTSNVAEIEASIQTAARQKNINLCAVESINQALNRLFVIKHKQEEVFQNGKRSKPWKPLAVIVVIAVVTIGYFLWQNQNQMEIENTSQLTKTDKVTTDSLRSTSQPPSEPQEVQQKEPAEERIITSGKGFD